MRFSRLVVAWSSRYEGSGSDTLAGLLLLPRIYTSSVREHTGPFGIIINIQVVLIASSGFIASLLRRPKTLRVEWKHERHRRASRKAGDGGPMRRRVTSLCVFTSVSVVLLL